MTALRLLNSYPPALQGRGRRAAVARLLGDGAGPACRFIAAIRGAPYFVTIVPGLDPDFFLGRDVYERRDALKAILADQLKAAPAVVFDWEFSEARGPHFHLLTDIVGLLRLQHHLDVWHDIHAQRVDDLGDLEPILWYGLKPRHSGANTARKLLRGPSPRVQEAEKHLERAAVAYRRDRSQLQALTPRRRMPGRHFTLNVPPQMPDARPAPPAWFTAGFQPGVWHRAQRRVPPATPVAPGLLSLLLAQRTRLALLAHLVHQVGLLSSPAPTPRPSLPRRPRGPRHPAAPLWEFPARPLHPCPGGARAGPRQRRTGRHHAPRPVRHHHPRPPQPKT